MKVYFDTVGCRLNQAEIELMAAQFEAEGHVLVDSPDSADLVVINSCTVTSAAASDSRQKVRQANRAGAGQIVVTGCLATTEPLEIGHLTGVSRVIPNEQKDELLRIILGPLAKGAASITRKPIPGIHKRTRAFIKAQDGCDNFCTFCITRIARGRSISLPREEVLGMVLAAQAGGSKEVVLSGVNLGAWGNDLQAGENLCDLIQFLLDHSQVERIRLSSLEPWDFRENFFRLWQDERMCRHLHLPLQSGSMSELKRMARKITPERFARLVQVARDQIPSVSITTDIIVGFPGETEGEFTESLAFVEQMQFSGGHVFRYSKRQGTPAARLKEDIPGRIAADRSRLMRATLEKSTMEFAARQVGRTLKVLWETPSPKSSACWKLEGYTDTYLKVKSESTEARYNVVDLVKIVSATKEGLIGELIR